MSCIELSEESVAEFIKEGKVVVKGYSDNCGFCTRLAPVFDALAGKMPEYKFGQLKLTMPSKDNPKPESSSFKRNYMKMDKGDNVKEAVPVVVVFENGQLKWRRFGFMDEANLKKFIETGEEPKPQAQNPDQAKNALKELYAAKGERITIIEISQNELAQINGEIAQLMGRKNAN